jgi:hypothetical protein
MAKQPLDKIAEVPRRRLPAQVIALALHDVGRKVGRRRGLIRREEADVPDEHAADDGIFARRDRSAAVRPTLASICSRLAAPLPSPNNAYASDAVIAAKSLQNPPPTTRLSG